MIDHKSAYDAWNVSEEILALGQSIEEELQDVFKTIRLTREHNQLKVLKAFQDAHMAEADFGGSSGYGYDDRGRDKLEEVYAKVMGTEKALVRWQISSGTHALALILFGILRPGDDFLSITGTLYDTLQDTLGNGEVADTDMGSLRDLGVSCRQMELLSDGTVDFDHIKDHVKPNTKMVWIQRSRGYKNRPAITIEQIERAVQVCRSINPSIIVAVDNCYGEFVETREPGDVGSDIMAGSLIKNPGGGLAQTGGYVAGRADLVEKAAYRLTAPGVGSEIGPTMGISRQIAQGFYQAPHSVAECLQGLVFTAALLEKLGYKTSPGPREIRSDIVQVIEFSRAEELIHFCQSIQQVSPVDSFVSPVPAPMPGYEAEVIMAAGAFVQGSSMELSADGPLRAPYQAYMQGGIVYENIKLAALVAAQKMKGNRD